MAPKPNSGFETPFIGTTDFLVRLSRLIRPWHALGGRIFEMQFLIRIDDFIGAVRDNRAFGKTGFADQCDEFHPIWRQSRIAIRAEQRHHRYLQIAGKAAEKLRRNA